MPIYEYACRKCEHVFDVLQKMSDEPLKFCPECGAPELRKLISAPSFRLKGGGWYETDFKTGNKRNLVEGGEKKAESSDGAGDKADKSDKKSAAGNKAEAGKTTGSGSAGKAADTSAS
jgi:putative FmdB family regulatory protein